MVGFARTGVRLCLVGGARVVLAAAFHGIETVEREGGAGGKIEWCSEGGRLGTACCDLCLKLCFFCVEDGARCGSESSAEQSASGRG